MLTYIYAVQYKPRNRQRCRQSAQTAAAAAATGAEDGGEDGEEREAVGVQHHMHRREARATVRGRFVEGHHMHRRETRAPVCVCEFTGVMSMSVC